VERDGELSGAFVLDVYPELIRGDHAVAAAVPRDAMEGKRRG
jgi:hypothetical protein